MSGRPKCGEELAPYIPGRQAKLEQGGMFLPPGSAMNLRHCGVAMAHERTAMQWTVNRFAARQPGSGKSLHMFVCQKCAARAVVDLQVLDAVWQHRPPAEVACQAPGQDAAVRRAAGRRAAIAEWNRRVAEQMSATPDSHAMAIADAVVAALEELG